MKQQKKKKAPWYSVVLCAVTTASLLFAMPLLGCKDYDDDIDDLKGQLNNIKTDNTSVTTLQTDLNNLKSKAAELDEEKGNLEQILKDLKADNTWKQCTCGDEKEKEPTSDIVYARPGGTFTGTVGTDHTHKQSDKLSYNENEHWYACEESGCSKRYDVKKHTYQYVYNDTEHWKECECGRELEDSRGKHDIDNNIYSDDNNHWTQCKVCEAKFAVTQHEFDEETWEANDEEQHGHPCTGCDVIGMLESHTFQYAYNDTEHWKECKCGRELEDSRSEHDSDNNTYSDDSNHWTQCQVCEAKFAVTQHEFDEETWEAKDEEQHGHPCIGCDVIGMLELHEFNHDGICDKCEYDSHKTFEEWQKEERQEHEPGENPSPKLMALRRIAIVHIAVESVTAEDQVAEDEASEGEESEGEEQESEAPVNGEAESEEQKQVTSENGEPESKAPESNVPESNMPESNVPESNVPESNVPESNVPESNVPESNVPASNVPEEKTPEKIQEVPTLPDANIETTEAEAEEGA